jgi:Domain of unknown function (DUF4375)
VTFDGRIDRATVGDDEDELPLLILDRLVWESGEEEALARGPRALLLLSAAHNEIFNGGTLQLLHNRGQDVGVMRDAARLVRARPYERFFRDLMKDALETIRIPAEMEDWAELAQQEVVEAYDDRYYALEEEHGSPLAFALRYVHEHPDQFFLSEAEVAADEDDFIRRLVARVGSRPGLMEASLPDFPPLLRRLYREVGASGWGPGSGFRSPAEVVAARPSGWPETLLPVAVDEAGTRYVVDTAKPQLEVGALPAGRELPQTPLSSTFLMGPGGGLSLRGWLESWLRGLCPFES